jgi:hypothetical protein
MANLFLTASERELTVTNVSFWMGGQQVALSYIFTR